MAEKPALSYAHPPSGNANVCGPRDAVEKTGIALLNVHPKPLGQRPSNGGARDKITPGSLDAGQKQDNVWARSVLGWQCCSGHGLGYIVSIGQ